MAPPTPRGEAERLRELYRLRVLDTAPEEAFDRVARFASRLLKTPIALVSLVDAERQWFKAKVGVSVQQTPRDRAFCAHTIAGDEVLVVPDAREDPRFADDPFVTGPPHFRFYAGAPLRTPAGAIGTLCVIDHHPRTLSEEDRQALEELAATVMDLLTLRSIADDSRLRVELIELAEELSEVGHWRLDTEREELFWSPQVHRIHGLDPKHHQPTLEHALSAYHEDDRETVTAQVARAIEERVPFDFEARVVRPDGEVRVVRAVGRAEVDPIGDTVRGIFGVFIDLTEDRQITDRLSYAEKMASIGTLAAGMAHEINNPLAYIQANAESLGEELGSLLDDEASAREAQQMLADIEEGVRRIQRIVHGLKSFSKEGNPDVGPVDLARVFEVTERLCSAELRHRARFVLDLDPSCPAVNGEQTQLVQVVVNLVVNAAQAIEPGAPKSNTVRVTSGLASGGRAFFEVSDTGHGMSEEVRRRALTPFFTTRSRSGGTGLGLSFCHGIVSSFGGEIILDSAPGQGTRVRVLLPLARPPEPRERASDVPAPETAERARVLLIDDEAPVARALARLLRAYEVVVEVDPRKALTRLEAGERFDVVLCDLMMPHLSGPRLYERLQTARPDLLERFVVITGGAFSAESRAFLDRAKLPVVYKPVSGDLIRGIVEDIVAARVADD